MDEFEIEIKIKYRRRLAIAAILGTTLGATLGFGLEALQEKENLGNPEIPKIPEIKTQ